MMLPVLETVSDNCILSLVIADICANCVLELILYRVSKHSFDNVYRVYCVKETVTCF